MEDLGAADRAFVGLSHGLEDRFVGTVAAHDSMGTIEEDCVYLFAEAYLADVLIIFFFNLEDLGQLFHLLLQPPDLLLHLYALCVADLLRVSLHLLLVVDLAVVAGVSGGWRGAEDARLTKAHTALLNKS